MFPHAFNGFIKCRQELVTRYNPFGKPGVQKQTSHSYAVHLYFTQSGTTVIRHKDEPAPLDTPPCISQLIQDNNKKATVFSLIAIYRYKYQKRYVYYGLSACCDQFNPLFDQSCTALCSPNGGFAGTGDGKCPDFFKEATEKTVIWEQPQ